MILVTGGAGFIGANFVLVWCAAGDEPIVNLDKLTYAGNLGSLAPLAGNPRHAFVRGDIGDRSLVLRLLAAHRPRAIVHFAAESHVDRSIHGPLQFPEKLIPLMIVNAIKGKPLPVYGDGLNVRDWLYVGDHCAALRAVLAKGRAGETYNIGGNAEIRNVEVVRTVCRVLAELVPGRDFARLISFVQDRPGHDRRYAIDATKIRRDLGWTPRETFETGLRRTVRWYLDHGDWLAAVTSGDYQKWVTQNYGAVAQPA